MDFDFDKVFEGADMMPRSHFHAKRADALNMKTADEIISMDDGTAVDPDNFENTTAPKSRVAEFDEPKQIEWPLRINADEKRAYTDMMVSLSRTGKYKSPQGLVLAMKQTANGFSVSTRDGNVLANGKTKFDTMQVLLNRMAETRSKQPKRTGLFRRKAAEALGESLEMMNITECGMQAVATADHSEIQAMMVAGQSGTVTVIGTDDDPMIPDAITGWISDANQMFMDRTGNGETWTAVVNDLARRFSEFFDGSYEAFDFAADAFARRAWDMGLWESDRMIEQFDKTGRMSVAEGTMEFPTLRHRGQTTTLKPYGTIRMLQVSPGGINTIKFSGK